MFNLGDERSRALTIGTSPHIANGTASCRAITDWKRVANMTRKELIEAMAAKTDSSGANGSKKRI